MHDRDVSLVNDLAPRFHAMSDQELRDQTRMFREKLAAGATEKDILGIKVPGTNLKFIGIAFLDKINQQRRTSVYGVDSFWGQKEF